MDDDDLVRSDEFEEEPTVRPPRRHRAARLDPFEVLPPLEDEDAEYAAGEPNPSPSVAGVGGRATSGRPAGSRPRKRLTSGFSDPLGLRKSRENEFRVPPAWEEGSHGEADSNGGSSDSGASGEYDDSGEWTGPPTQAHTISPGSLTRWESGAELASSEGVAPPRTRREPARKPLRRYGYSPDEVGQSPESWRDRLLPRSVIGIATLILALSVGAAFSGVILFSYYQYQIDQSNNKVNSLINGLKQQFNNAQGDLSATANAAKAEIQNALGPLGKAGQGGNVEANLAKDLAPSMYYVHTQNSAGQPSVGTAFVIYASGGQSFLLTSYSTIQAATVSPGPQVYIQQGNGPSQSVTVRSWDPANDLALVVISQTLPAIKTAPTSPGPQLGDTVYALSGFGSSGAAVVAGTIADASSSGIATDAAIGPAFQGGPIVNASGQVIAVASRSYSPGGFANETIWYAPLVQAACTHVLSCSGGTIPGN